MLRHLDLIHGSKGQWFKSKQNRVDLWVQTKFCICPFQLNKAPQVAWLKELAKFLSCIVSHPGESLYRYMTSLFLPSPDFKDNLSVNFHCHS